MIIERNIKKVIQGPDSGEFESEMETLNLTGNMESFGEKFELKLRV